MRRMTNIAAAMLVMTCAMTAVPQKAEASLWDALISLTGGQVVDDGAVQSWQRIRLRNNTSRHVLFEVWAGGGGGNPFLYDESGNNVDHLVYVPPGGEVWVWAKMSYLAVRMATSRRAGLPVEPAAPS